MSNATELLRRALESFDWMDVDNSLTEEIRTYLEAEKQYDALSEHYVAGLSNSMKAYKEYFKREEERVMELFAAAEIGREMK